MITSAVVTIFVCFAENYEDFERAHPELYKELLSAWQLSHPNEIKYINDANNKNDNVNYTPPSNKVVIKGKFTRDSTNSPSMTSGSAIFDEPSDSTSNVNNDNTNSYQSQSATMNTVGSYIYSEIAKTYESLFPNNSSYSPNRYTHLPTNNSNKKMNPNSNINDEESVYF
eukprot:gene18792-24559_t